MKSSKLCAVVGLVGLLLGSRAAFATVTPHHATECYYVSGSSPFPNTAGQLANTGIATLTMWCPIEYDEGSAPSHMTLSGFSNGCPSAGNYGLSYNVCVAHAAGGAQTCNPAPSIPSGGCTAGVYQIGANVPALSTGDYVYAAVTIGVGIGSGQNASYSTFFGYQVTH